ncbi:hypothetical protein DSO57_1036276 [Entomophthora muscae]|uniref:Uncharacterized protein n=1 Tax=Entomophthora muscae TaxID=34485 RepID=A0ACC2SCQ1_9FUNG|nr:hypothetical protein DSO57_1036276 [Entomophthora muscae]
MSAQEFFQAPSLMPQPADETTMPAYVAQRLQSAALEPFAVANNNNAATWIQSAQSKLAQMECPQQFWIAEISICLTYDAGTWCNKWHKEHTDKNWDTFKQDFLARFVLKDTALMIIHQVKNLTQTGTVKELTCAYEELRLCAPSSMAFDTPPTHLMYYNALKLYVMRHVNLDLVTNLQSLYCEAEKAEQTSNALHKAKTGKQERPKDSHPSGRSSQPPPGVSCSEVRHRYTTGNPNLRIAFVLSLS